jgi:SAM-dependent methyltransferase
MRVLETAAGTGIVTRLLRDLLPAEAHLTATDLNPPMLAVARRKFRADESVEFREASAVALPFPDGIFDALACQFGVMFFPDKDAGFREARRVLARGGGMCSVFGTRTHTTTSGGSLTRWRPPFSRPIRPVSTPCRSATTELSRSRRLCWRQVTATSVSTSSGWRRPSLASAAAFARGIVFGNPLVEQIRARGGEPERVVEAVIAAFQREFGPDPGRMPLQAIIFEAVRRQEEGR